MLGGKAFWWLQVANQNGQSFLLAALLIRVRLERWQCVYTELSGCLHRAGNRQEYVQASACLLQCLRLGLSLTKAFYLILKLLLPDQAFPCKALGQWFQFGRFARHLIIPLHHEFLSRGWPA